MNFKDKIHITGELQPSSTRNISCPRIRSDATVAYLIQHGTMVVPGDTICILDGQEVKNRYEAALTSLSNAKADYEKTKAQLHLKTQMLIAQKQTIEASTAITKLDTLQQKFVSPIQRQLIELELKKAAIEQQKIENRLVSLKKINASELRTKEIMITQAENQLKSATSLLEQLTITAEEAGMVFRAKLRGSDKLINEGDIVWGRMTIALMPNTSSYQVKLQLPESLYKRIEKGFQYQGTVESIPNSFLSGKIKNKAPIGKPIEKESQVKLFEIIASVDSINYTPQAGQSVKCEILAKEIPNAIALPLLSVFPEDSTHIVYIKRENGFEKRSIEIAFQNATTAILKEGVNPEEKVALSKPPNKLISSQKVIKPKT